MAKGFHRRSRCAGSREHPLGRPEACLSHRSWIPIIALVDRAFPWMAAQHFLNRPGHGKTRFPPMGQFISRERFGKPQVLAGLLLFLFVGQCVWLLARGTPQLTVEGSDFFRVQEGLAQWNGDSIAGTPSMARAERGEMAPPELESNEDYDPNHSPLWYLMASAPLLGWEAS